MIDIAPACSRTLALLYSPWDEQRGRGAKRGSKLVLESLFREDD